MCVCVCVCVFLFIACNFHSVYKRLSTSGFPEIAARSVNLIMLFVFAFF